MVCSGGYLFILFKYTGHDFLKFALEISNSMQFFFKKGKGNYKTRQKKLLSHKSYSEMF